MYVMDVMDVMDVWMFVFCVCIVRIHCVPSVLSDVLRSIIRPIWAGPMILFVEQMVRICGQLPPFDPATPLAPLLMKWCAHKLVSFIGLCDLCVASKDSKSCAARAMAAFGIIDNAGGAPQWHSCQYSGPSQSPCHVPCLPFNRFGTLARMA